MAKTIDDVRSFWESSPLWTGESQFPAGSREFFEEHRQVYLADCFAGEFDPRFLPPAANREKVLDLGCGPGFWTVELARHGCRQLTAADLTENALALARQRCEIYGVAAEFSRENAEGLTFADNTFRHVNCQGVIHHTPDTERCLAEIARVLQPGGTASVSVYYRNLFLRAWPLFRGLGRLFSRVGAGLKGRGREGIYAVSDPDEIVRLYDGDRNPIGKAYTEAQFRGMLAPHFQVEECYLHFFPARTLPFRLPRFLHRFLDRNFGFMIYATLRKN